MKITTFYNCTFFELFQYHIDLVRLIVRVCDWAFSTIETKLLENTGEKKYQTI